MYRYLLSGLLVVVIVGAVAFSRQEDKPSLVVTPEKRNPWTNLSLNQAPEQFQFAIVSDRTGGHREKVFSQAVARLNLLQPEFVVSVGDLIEGGRKTPKALDAEWQEFDGYVKTLQMPFFYVAGNHDVGNATTTKMWEERLGRRHYHFVYRDVLFLVLNTDDPTGIGAPSIGNEQLAYAKKALEDNSDVRWTMVFLHKPIWTATNLEKRNWLAVEQALASRPYTVFCGHVHRYRKFVRQGRDYYQLATTGGGSKMRGIEYGEFDHLVWVTMKKTGPVLTNILLDSILPDTLQVPESTEKSVARKLLPRVPVRGTIYMDGVPVTGAVVILTPKEGTKGVRADALTEGDGSFRPSTYTAFDGMVPGTYTVAVTQPRPMVTAAGKAGPNQLPARYATAKGGLEVEVPPEGGEIRVELTR